MAKSQSTSSSDVRRFDKELSEDVSDYHLPENSWTQARNAINNSKTGDLGKLGNEPSNQFCTNVGVDDSYDIIGAIHTEADIWVIFSTNNTNSEIGLFKESLCQYTAIVNDNCLNFSTFHLVRGVSRATSDCLWKVYWDDGYNPSRLMTVKTDDFAANLYTNANSPIPWIQNCVDSSGNPPTSPLYPVGCITCTNTAALNCEEIRLARHIKTPCITVQRGQSGGTLANGSYFAVIAYTLNEEKATDYFKPSNVQPLFDHDNVAGSIEINVTNTDTSYDGYELVVVSNVNSQIIAKKIGNYNITQQKVTLDTIDPQLVTVPISQIPLMTPVIEKTEAMYKVTDYLIRVAPTTKFDFNYQPLANQIVTKWVTIEYPEDYYRKGGSNTGYMRDEVYPFFIRYIYDTGDKSSSYHIPGRPALTVGAQNENAFIPIAGADALPNEILALDAYTWSVYNLAQVTATTASVLPDGGVATAEGIMGYWESTEYYPNDKPEIWNANDLAHPWTSVTGLPYAGTNPGSVNTTTNTVVIGDYDLCGKPIRHHRFPDNYLDPTYGSGGAPETPNHYSSSSIHFPGNVIKIMGVKFENVRPPVDNQGVLIPGIVGYEILRGARNGNKTVVAKGIINNMRQYDTDLDGDNNISTGQKGYYQNYPYNSNQMDPFLMNQQTSITASTTFPNFCSNTETPNWSANGANSSASDLFSFHSPDTTFNKPFLSSRELKIYEEIYGIVNGKFEWSEKHPKAKVLTNQAFFLSLFAGLGIAFTSMNGKRTITTNTPRIQGQEWSTMTYGQGGTGVANLTGGTVPVTPDLAVSFLNTAQNIYDNLTTDNGLWLLSSLGGLNATEQEWNLIKAAAGTWKGTGWVTGGTRDTSYVESDFGSLPNIVRYIPTGIMFSQYLVDGTDTTMRIIRAASKWKDFALKYNSHAYYGYSIAPTTGNRRRAIKDQSYIGPEIVNLNNSTRINNLYRNKFVATQLNTGFGPTATLDNSRITAGQAATNGYISIEHPTENAFAATLTSCWYAGLKQRIRNQYGQIDSIQQVPVNNCFTDISSSKTDVQFGGDIYIGRYTEKTTFFYFYDWLYNLPDGFEFNYDDHKMVNYPRYWLNMEQFNANDFTSSVLNNLLDPYSWTLPNDYYNLDNLQCLSFNLTVKNAYFYLFNSGVRDFFVESEVNVDLRDWGNLDSERHFPQLDTKTIFDTSIIKSGNYYKYDNALSIVNTLPNKISWGNVQARSYDPYISETCYTFTPTRVIYSLPAQYESKADYWRIFLANNYYDFNYYVTCIKPINKSGAIIFFDSGSPVQFQGTDQLKTELDTKLTIGDGGLFSQPLQNIMNADGSYEYGSCQDSFSVINTPMGVYWMSQNQGKIFKIGSGLEEVSIDNMKWWFAQYLPYELTEAFPDFELTNNPVSGIGCQSIYDNQNQLLYFCKRDYLLRDDIPATTQLTYLTNNVFTVNNVINGELFPIGTTILGDPLYFKDASWTVSYDPKTQGFIGYHDWHPTLTLPGKNTFMSVSPEDKRSIWIHNERCDSYCNYYGIDYPFEVEWSVNTANQVNSLRSIEYQLEVYKYAANCYDRYQELNFNFDEAVIYNTEQCSGLLKLNLSPRNDVAQLLQYPVINPTNIEILYSKIEQKYRFNQFWDITRERGGQDVGIPGVPSFAQQTIWNTQPNGYVKLLNPNNLDYNKFALDRKKFRHYTNTVLLRRLVSGDKKFLVMLSTNKNLYSPR
jgi:hypothetical protein